VRLFRRRILCRTFATALLAGLFTARAGAQAAEPETRSCLNQNGLPICVYPGPTGSTGAYGIASGLGELWLGSPTLNEIFPFSTSGVAGTGFPIPDESAKPEGIALGPDKRIWFTEWSLTSLAAMTSAGVVTEYPFESTYATVIISADKKLWVSTDYDGICRVSVNGSYVCYTLPDGQNDAQPTGLALGSDGNVFGMPDARIADATGQRHHIVVLEHVAIKRIDGGIVDVWLEHSLAQVVEHHDARLCEGSDYAQERLEHPYIGRLWQFLLRII
jgi:streptogramin lyase